MVELPNADGDAAEFDENPDSSGDSSSGATKAARLFSEPLRENGRPAQSDRGVVPGDADKK